MGGDEKLRPAPLGRSDPDLTFSTVPYGRPVFFSQIILLNLVRARMGPATTYFLYCPGLCCPHYSKVHRWYRIGLPPLHLTCAPVWGDSAKATPGPKNMGSTGCITWKFQGEWRYLSTWWVDLDYGTRTSYTPPKWLLCHRCPPQLTPDRRLRTCTYIDWWS